MTQKLICTPQQAANFFLDNAKRDDIELTQLKLMKLIYIAYGWYLAITHNKLFEEPIKAWKHGPVIESIYHEFKHFKRDPIDAHSIVFDLDTSKTIVPRIQDLKVIDVLKTVWMGYKDFTAESMVNREHKAGTAWSKVFKENKNETILDEDIKEDFYNRIRLYIDA